MSAQLAAKKTILLIDGDTENRDYLKGEFESRGFMILEADDTIEAIKVASANKVHAVMIDIELSKSQRVEFNHAIHTDACGAPLIFLIAGPSMISREEAYDLGASGVFSKPFDPEMMISQIAELLVPASTRWKSRPLNESRRSRRVSTSVQKLRLGRGGFALSLENAGPSLEGEVVEFDVQVRDQQDWHLRGSGVIRYIKRDVAATGRDTWGIEFASLDEASLSHVMSRTATDRPLSYIPKILN